MKNGTDEGREGGRDRGNGRRTENFIARSLQSSWFLGSSESSWGSVLSPWGSTFGVLPRGFNLWFLSLSLYFGVSLES